MFEVESDFMTIIDTFKSHYVRRDRIYEFSFHTQRLNLHNTQRKMIFWNDPV